MKLVWKLLRHHISPAQLAGFFLANLLGLLIVLLSLQLYLDIKPIFSEQDGIIRPDYLVLHKRLSALDAIGIGSVSTFSESEMAELGAQPAVERVGAFTASQYKVSCNMGIGGMAQIGTELFFESVPDSFVDIDLSKWQFSEADGVIPIILPKSYLAIYNFGFAPSQNLPKLSEGVVGMLEMTVSMKGAGRDELAKGRVVGFTSRLNTILVPETFMRWSNDRYAPGSSTEPSRIILKVSNPADDRLVTYIKEKGYELEEDRLDAGRMTFFLRLCLGIVMSVGLLISLLSLFILMLSIYLLVEKNSEKIRSLLLIGYSRRRVAMPYQWLVAGMNAAVLLLALGGLVLLRSLYMQRLSVVFPISHSSSFILPSLFFGLVLTSAITLANIIIIRRRINQIWNN